MTTLLFDIETNGLLDAVTKIHCLVIHNPDTGETWRCVESGQGKNWVAPDGKIEPQMVVGLAMLMEADVIVGHNIVRFDIPVCQKFYPWFKPKGKVRDTLVTAKLLWPHIKSLDKGDVKLREAKLIGSHSLKAWGIRLNALKGDYAEQTDWKEFTPAMLDYCVQDVVGPTLALWKLIQSKNPSEDALEVEHKFTFVAHQYELHGFRFDVKAAQALHAQLVKRRLELEAQLQEKYHGWEEPMKTPEYWTATWRDQTHRAPTKSAAESELWSSVKKSGAKRKEMTFTPGPLAKKRTLFNPGSRAHIARVLMEEHGWKPTKFTDGGDPEMSEEVLEHLDLPEAKLLIEYLMLQKRLGQLAEGDNAWLKLVDSKGYIHGRIDPMGTVTSRCGHSQPNLAQVPSVDSPFGAECRALFIPDEGHVLVGADASGIQLRVIAHYAAIWDGGKYANLITKGDIHTANQKAAGLPTRATAKTFIYAWLLGAGDAKIGAITGKGAAEGRELKARFLAGFPALKALKDTLNSVTRESGYVIGLDGRHMPAENGHAGMGSLLQGFEAVVMKWANWLVWEDFTSRGWVHGRDFGLCAFVHDELQASVRPDYAEEAGKAIVNAIERAGEKFGTKCPLAGEWKIGANWRETH